MEKLFGGREGGWKRRIFLKIEYVYDHLMEKKNIFIVWKKEV